MGVVIDKSRRDRQPICVNSTSGRSLEFSHFGDLAAFDSHVGYERGQSGAIQIEPLHLRAYNHAGTPITKTISSAPSRIMGPIKIAPRHEDAYNGRVYAAAGELDRAIEDYDW